jgi:hypothetical protein
MMHTRRRTRSDTVGTEPEGLPVQLPRSRLWEYHCGRTRVGVSVLAKLIQCSRQHDVSPGQYHSTVVAI